MRRLAIVLLLAVSGCGRNPFLPIYGAGDGAGFSAAPMDISNIQSIASLGTLLPVFHSQTWDQTLPSDHIYLYDGAVAGLPVYAPALGVVSSVQSDSNNEGQRIEVRVSSTLSYYFDHVLPAVGISNNQGVASGERLGSSTALTPAVDFGVIDTTYTAPQLINPARYSDTTLHCQNPLKYYNAPLQAELYGKVIRAGTDKNGRPDLDQDGKLVGNWFLQSLSSAQSSQSSAWSQELSFAYDSAQPSQPAIAIGGTLGVTGSFDTAAGDPDPATVTQASNLVIYHLNASAVLCVQMMNSQEIEAEYFPSGSGSFDSNASYYLR